METIDTKIYIDGQQFDGLADLPSLEPETDGGYADDLPPIVIAERAEFTGTLTMTREQAMRLAELISPYFWDFSEAFHETVRTSPKRWHIFRYTKRARIRKKHYKSFVTELIYRIETKAKAREDHATV